MFAAIALSASLFVSAPKDNPCSWLPEPFVGLPPGSLLRQCIELSLHLLIECQIDCYQLSDPPDPACCAACRTSFEALVDTCYATYGDAWLRYGPSSQSLTMPGCVFVSLTE